MPDQPPADNKADIPAPHPAAADEAEATAQQGAPVAGEEDRIAAEDAAVEEVLSEAELIYRDDEENGDFVPSESVSADQSLDYPIDI